MNTTESVLQVTLNMTEDANQTSLRPPQGGFQLPWEVHYAESIREVYIWVLVAIGLPANTACVATVLSMANSPFYVALLAVADSLALVVKLLYHQLYTHDVLNDAGCYFEYFVSFFSCYANWVLALICLERFVAVCFPFKKQVYFSRRRAYASSAGLGFSLFLCFIPTFFFNREADDTGEVCIEHQSMTLYKENVWGSILLPSIVFFIPFVLVVILSTLTIVRLHQNKRSRKSLHATKTCGRSGTEHTVTVMLISAAVVFLILTLPACVHHLFGEKVFNHHVLKEYAQDYLMYQVVTLLIDSNHAVNFFVYFLSAGRFRLAFKELLQRCPCHSRLSGASRKESSSSGQTTNVTLTPSRDNLNCDTKV